MRGHAQAGHGCSTGTADQQECSLTIDRRVNVPVPMTAADSEQRGTQQGTRGQTGVLLVTTELHLAFVWLGNDLHEHITTLTVDVQSFATHNVDDQLTCGNVTSASGQCWHWFGCLQ